MLQDKLLLILCLLFVISMLALLSDKLKIPYPILLVISGLIISFMPGFPLVRLDPDIVFVIFLPPLLYSAAWNTSWSAFWTFKAPIGRMAFGLVILTATGVAYAAHYIIPGFSLALGFVLGGIISPPDAVAASSILRQLKVPRFVSSILEGESLINDAASLVIFRFALISLVTGQFVFWKTGTDFIMVAGIGIVTGVAVGHMVYAIHRFLPTTPSIDTALTLITPYVIYLTAEHFRFSGVLAVVSGGLYLSYRSEEIFAFDSRLRITTVWTVLEFLLNGFVFILIGLQLPSIIKATAGYSLSQMIKYALVISSIALAIRIAWVFTGAFLMNLFNKRAKKTQIKYGWKPVFVIAWSGMRGVVSLASALSIPLTLKNHENFPQRNLILFITFSVILFTLVFQGLTLPVILRIIKMEVNDDDERKNQEIRLRLANAALGYIHTHCTAEIKQLSAFSRVKEHYERMEKTANDHIVAVDQPPPAYLKTYHEMLLSLIDVRRNELHKMHKANEYADHLIRAKERELDFEEARLRKF